MPQFPHAHDGGNNISASLRGRGEEETGDSGKPLSPVPGVWGVSAPALSERFQHQVWLGKLVSHRGSVSHEALGVGQWHTVGAKEQDLELVQERG